MRNSFKKFVLLLAALFCSFTAASLMQNTCLHHGQRGSNTDVADGGIRKVRARTRFAQQSVPGHSLRYDLSGPPPASQVFATGLASSRQTML